MEIGRHAPLDWDKLACALARVARRIRYAQVDQNVPPRSPQPGLEQLARLATLPAAVSIQFNDAGRKSRTQNSVQWTRQAVLRALG